MAGRPTLFGAGEILRSFFARSAEPPPSFYLALVCQLAPNPYLTGDELDEPSGSSYARAEIPNDLTNWGNTDQLQLVANGLDINFVQAGETWGRINYWALCNADVGGNVYFYGEMASEVIVNAGDTVVLGANELVIEFGPFTNDQNQL